MFAPEVPFVKDDGGALVPLTLAGVLTCAAVNAGAVRADARARVVPVMPANGMPARCAAGSGRRSGWRLRNCRMRAIQT